MQNLLESLRSDTPVDFPQPDHESILPGPASSPTSTQPKDISAASDSTVFVVEIRVVEAFRENESVLELKYSYRPSAVAASAFLIDIGREVRRKNFNSVLFA